MNDFWLNYLSLIIAEDLSVISLGVTSHFESEGLLSNFFICILGSFSSDLIFYFLGSTFPNFARFKWPLKKITLLLNNYQIEEINPYKNHFWKLVLFPTIKTSAILIQGIHKIPYQTFYRFQILVVIVKISILFFISRFLIQFLPNPFINLPEFISFNIMALVYFLFYITISKLIKRFQFS
jgi:membrane protein DedA with SNARE-associated domain